MQTGYLARQMFIEEDIDTKRYRLIQRKKSLP